MASLMTKEQSQALESLSQRERIDVVIGALVRRLEKTARREALRTAIECVEASDTKANALQRLKAAYGEG